MNVLDRPRCTWVNPKNPLYVKYHDAEWGQPLQHDVQHFELLALETFVAGLSWETVLNKREAFREAFDHFTPATVASYDDVDVSRLLNNPRIIRNRKKICATISNAQVFLGVVNDYGSFDAYIWSFLNSDHPVHMDSNITISPESTALAADLKKRGIRFFGPTTAHSYLQAAGFVIAHSPGCYLSEKSLIL